jgi:hypothetical protein
MTDTILLIDNRVIKQQITLHEITPLQRSAARRRIYESGALTFRAYGFGEVVGYSGRQAVMSMGGNWNEGVPSQFSVTSFGFKEDGAHVYTRGDKLIAEAI